MPISTNFILEAEQLIKEKLFDNAINICKEGLLLYPAYSSAFIVLAKAYFLNNDIESALQIITKAQQLFPLSFAVTNMKNSIESGDFALNTSNENILLKEENINNLELTDKIEEIEISEVTAELIAEVDEIANEVETEIISEVQENKENNTNNEVFVELDKIANLLKKAGESNIPNMKNESENIKNESEKINIENSILDAELQKIDYIAKTNVEKLYKKDLELPRTIVSTQLDWYSANHISVEVEYNNLHLFNKKMYFADCCDEQLQKIKLDTKTKDILDIAESLKGAVIPRIDEDEYEEEKFDVPVVASETMAKILVKQAKIPQAIAVYNMLILEKPDKIEFYKNQIDLLLNEKKNKN
ncbi:MAG: tetratricopeptide repeat protein [Bacteroidetes bacterium]|nr:tetratricopeptide repeat protein [Bacteroidota bacterium]